MKNAETGPRILVVEENAAQLTALCATLGNEGFRAVGASSAREAIELLDPARFQVAVIDDPLPDESVSSLLQQMRDRAPGIRVIVNARSGTYESAKAAINGGAFGYVDWPVDANELLHTLHRAVEESSREQSHASDDVLRIMALHSPDHVAKLDRHGTIEFINRARPGRTVEEMVGTPVYQWVLPETRPIIARALEQVFATGEHREYESYNPIHEGEPQWFAGKLRPIVEDGVVTGAVLASRRITARKQSEIGHVGQSRILRMLLRHRPLDEILDELCGVIEAQMPDLWCTVWLLDDEARRLRCAGSASLPEEFRTGLPDVLVASDDSTCGEAIARREPVLVEDIATDPLFAPHAGGALAVGVRASASFPIESPTGKILGTLALFLSKTDRVDGRSVAMLESSAHLAGLAIESHRTDQRMRRLSMATENAISGIACVDTSGRFVVTNETYTRMLGYGSNELNGIPWQETVHPDDIELATRAYERMLAEGRSRFEARGRRRDGSNFIKAVELVKAEPTGDFQGHYCMMHDVTARHEAERARDRLEEQLRQSQKMQALGQLAGGVAHDFNNLLTVILGNTELLLGRGSDASAPLSSGGSSLEQIRHAGERAAAMTRQLLAFSRHQVRRLEVLSLNHVVQRMDDLLRRLLPETIQLRTRLGDRTGAVEADAAQLEQVIVNLALNARDAIHGSGVLTIETAAVEVDEQQARDLGLAAPGRYACLSIRDTGSGIPPEVRDRMFEPFFTTKPTGKGTGLGLSTVYGIVTQAEGAVSIDSQVGQGSEVRVYLPQSDETRLARQPEREADARGGTETILICEDEGMVLDLARTILEQAGYQVLTANNGPRALEVAEAHPGPIHLLLTDVVMPRMNGKELAEQLSARRPDTRVLFVSGYPDDVTLIEELGGEIAFMEKPFSRSALRHRVRRILDEPS